MRTLADYYSRYRPGLGSVLAGLTVFSCFIHYVFLYMTFRVQKMRINACVVPPLSLFLAPPRPGP